MFSWNLETTNFASSQAAVLVHTNVQSTARIVGRAQGYAQVEHFSTWMQRHKLHLHAAGLWYVVAQ